MFSGIVAIVLMTGTVDQINDKAATIEYVKNNMIYHTTVSLEKSDCVPREGETVQFYEGHKISVCSPKSSR